MIYICAHKPFKAPELEGYMPIRVGANKQGIDGGCSDDTGDQIAEKNPNYCELTALYWIWKNTEDDYKGLVHYRRYFGKSNLSSDPDKIYTYPELVRMLDTSDIILPYIESFKQNAKDEIMVSCCTPEIFEELRRVTEELEPDYLSDFDAFWKNNKATLFNMMFCKRELFDSYCSWLFPVLFELEKRIDISGFDSYRARIFGFLSERLLNIWTMHRKLKAVHLPVIATEEGLGQKLQLLRRRVTNEMYFKSHKKA